MIDVREQSSIPMPSGDAMQDKREIIADENIEIDTLTNTQGEDQVIVFDYNRVSQFILLKLVCSLVVFQYV